MRCDLHVHSTFSGPTEVPFLRHVAQECYSEPMAVYDRAVARGMDLVTLTDHDSVEGALQLAHLPNTFVSEEVTVLLEGGRKLHVNVFDISEGQHQRIQELRSDAEALFAWLAENAIPASVNHLFSALTGERREADLMAPLGRLPLIEALNGSMPSGHNEAAQAAGRRSRMSPIGGSDAHSLAHVARAFTQVPGARTRKEFLAGLRRGRTIPVGRGGSYARLTSEVTRVVAAGYQAVLRARGAQAASRAQVATAALLLPVLPFLPVFTTAVYLHELYFRRRCALAYRQLVRQQTADHPVTLLRPPTAEVSA